AEIKLSRIMIHWGQILAARVDKVRGQHCETTVVANCDCTLHREWEACYWHCIVGTGFVKEIMALYQVLRPDKGRSRVYAACLREKLTAPKYVDRMSYHRNGGRIII